MFTNTFIGVLKEIPNVDNGIDWYVLKYITNLEVQYTTFFSDPWVVKWVWNRRGLSKCIISNNLSRLNKQRNSKHVYFFFIIVFPGYFNSGRHLGANKRKEIYEVESHRYSCPLFAILHACSLFDLEFDRSSWPYIKGSTKYNQLGAAHARTWLFVGRAGSALSFDRPPRSERNFCQLRQFWAASLWSAMWILQGNFCINVLFVLYNVRLHSWPTWVRTRWPKTPHPRPFHVVYKTERVPYLPLSSFFDKWTQGPFLYEPW